MSYSSGVNPHIRSSETVQSLTWSMVMALLPAVFAHIFFFPARAVFLVLLLFTASILEEITFIIFRDLPLKKYQDFKNGTIFLYALVFFMIVPVSLPMFPAAAGFAFSLFFTRSVFGGQGAAFFHPALAALIFLRVLFQGSGFFRAYAYPPSLFSWSVRGLLASGGIYLIFRKTFRPQVPLVFLFSVFGFSLLFQLPQDSAHAAFWLLTGFFAAVDFGTAPMHDSGRVIYAFLSGLIAAFLESGGLGTGTACAFAVLTGNIMTPWLDIARVKKALNHV